MYRALLFNSTYVIIGNGCSTPFWKARWLFGIAPKDMAPTLFASTRFKRRSMHQELTNSKWIKSIGIINNPSMIEEYVMLYLGISAISLVE
jgi:hypothetical protein